jgi:transposase InsO family protein
MSQKGNCWDNALAESFFRSLNMELIHGALYNARQESKTVMFEYIEVLADNVVMLTSATSAWKTLRKRMRFN